MADRLESLLERFSVSARMFHAGTLCGINDLAAEDGTGQLHFIRRGVVEVHHGGAVAVRVDTPSLLLYPRPLAHRFITDPADGADLTCAHLRFEGGAANPIAATLPAFVCTPLAQVHGLESVLTLLFDEAFQQHCGRRAVMDRLFEIALVQILRHLMENGQAQIGLLGGLAHPRLRNALVAMHEQPARDWALDTLAASAGMSRSVFANTFRETLGCTPGQYLQQWRVSLVQQGLRQGRPLKSIAGEVGYGSEAALSRAFKAQCGVSPREWKQAERA